MIEILQNDIFPIGLIIGGLSGWALNNLVRHYKGNKSKARNGENDKIN